MRLLIASLFLASVCISTTLADDIASGPKVGDKVEGFKADGVVGSVEGKEVDYLAERKGELTVFVFISQANFGRPAYRFLKALDDGLPEKSAGVAIWLNDKKDDAKDYLTRASKSLNFGKISCGAFGDTAGPKNWGINSDAHMTVVVTKEGKATHVFAYKVVNETDAKKVLEAITPKKK